MASLAPRMSGQYAAEIAKLRAENELLRAENWKLKDDARKRALMRGGRAAILQSKFRLPPRCADLFAAIAAVEPGQYISKVELFSDVWRDSEIDPKIVDIILCTLRKRLEKTGIIIETIWGKGLKIADESRPILDAIFSISEAA